MQRVNWIEPSENDRLKRNRSLSLKEKLELLEQMKEFTRRLMPEKNKKIWQRLRREG